MRIAIDAMGGSGGVDITAAAAIRALEKHPKLSLFLVGDVPAIAKNVAGCPEFASRITLVPAADRIEDSDTPVAALRGKRESSMFKAVELVKSGAADAMVSAGNTGALLLIGRHLLRTLNGIDKPAIIATIPAATHTTLLLDVGANPNCTGAQLFQFAAMGAVLYESLYSRGKARIALVNIGEEEFKGREETRQAAQLIQDCESLDFTGFMEGNALFKGDADVVVCDGFVGNVIIKTSAGVASVMSSLLAPALQQNPSLKHLTEMIDPSRFNGASLLGLQGSIVKSHGNADVNGFVAALDQAVNEVQFAIPKLIAARVANIMDAA